MRRSTVRVFRELGMQEHLGELRWHLLFSPLPASDFLDVSARPTTLAQDARFWFAYLDPS